MYVSIAVRLVGFIYDYWIVLLLCQFNNYCQQFYTVLELNNTDK